MSIESIINELRKNAVQPKDNPTYCQSCYGSGWVVIGKNERGVDIMGDCPVCQKNQKAIRNLKLKFANIPEIYKDNTLDMYDTNLYSKQEDRAKSKELVKIVNYWLDNFDEQAQAGRGLYFYSKNMGSGKTFLASALANELIDRGHEVKFATSVDIVKEIKRTWNNNGTESESDLIDELVNCEILFIDDFGTEKAKDWISERFYSIINGRYNSKRITCYTSNMALTDLEYDERVLSRIKSTVYMIMFPDEDIRNKIGREVHSNLSKSQKRF